MNNSTTSLIMFTAGMSTATTPVQISNLSQMNLQSISEMPVLSALTKNISFSYLTRLANYDIVLTENMTMSQILAAIQIPSLLTINAITNKLTADPTLRPIVVEGLVEDLPVLAALLGLENPQTCVSGDSFSYPINGLVFPLPVGTDLVKNYVVKTEISNTTTNQSVYINLQPNWSDISNRYNIPMTNVANIKVSFLSIHGFPLKVTNDLFLIFKLN